MLKKSVVLILVILFVMSSFVSLNVSADKNEYYDVQIYPFEDESDMFSFATKDDKVEVKVTSDIPVNVYIMSGDDYYYGVSDYSDAKVSKIETTSTSFKYTIPDDQSYYLVIFNPNNETATVDYEYTDLLEKRVDEAAEMFGFAAGLCIAIIIIGVVVGLLILGLIIYFTVFSKKKKPKYQQYPPGQGPPDQHQQNLPPPPPPPPPGK